MRRFTIWNGIGKNIEFTMFTWMKIMENGRTFKVVVRCCIYMCNIFLQHWCIAILVLFLSVPVVCLSPFILLTLTIFKCFGPKITDIAAEYLDRNLYGLMIGYNRVIDDKAHNRQQRGTNDMLFDLLFKDR